MKGMEERGETFYLIGVNHPGAKAPPLLWKEGSMKITINDLRITNYVLRFTIYRLPITSYQLPVTSYQLPITSYELVILFQPNL